MRLGVVIPVGEGREENLTAVLRCLEHQTVRPACIVVVQDGFGLDAAVVSPPTIFVGIPKHEPGREQPRNIGVRVLREQLPDVTHVWFLDSDVMVGPRCIEALHHAIAAGPQGRVLIGPYDWLSAGIRPIPGADIPSIRNDPRWAAFDANPPDRVISGDLSAGLACFSGNLVWPVDEFMRVGGFWSEIHHGRCEDGELGLRAVAMGVPMSYVADARGWHLWHKVAHHAVLERNARDVPMLNARHPWLQGAGVFVVDRDGKAFDVHCRCGQSVPTLGWWEHARLCPATDGAIGVQ